MARVRTYAGVLLVLSLLLIGVATTGAQDTTATSPVPVGDTLSVTIGEAQRLALRQNPAFLADRQETEIARGQLRQARTYNFNPEVSFDAPGIGATGALGEYEARLTQEVEWAGQRGLRIGAARIGLDRAEASVRNAARQTLADVSTAFYTALAAEQRLAVARELSQLNERLLTATRVQAREGEISSMEANLAEIEAGRARARVLAAQREATSARLELQRLTGILPDQEVRLLDEVPAARASTALDSDSLIALALARRPDLAGRTHAVDQAESLTGLARREAIPNVRIGLFVERKVLAYASAPVPGSPAVGSVLESPRFGVGVSVPVPVFDRNQGEVAEREAQAQQARLRRSATELAVRTQVTDAYRAFLAASE